MYMKNNVTSNQERKPTLKNGNPINTKTQFGQPGGNKRNNGSWKKSDTPRFKLEKMMQMTEKELLKIVSNKDAPYFERKIARCINSGQWREIDSMINQVYGKPVQHIEQTNTDATLTPEEKMALFDKKLSEHLKED